MFPQLGYVDLRGVHNWYRLIIECVRANVAIGTRYNYRHVVKWTMRDVTLT